jgi:hypothetical protein
MPKKTYTFRELVKALKDYDKRFEVYVARGKGSERMLYHPDVDGRPESYPLKCHGEGGEIRKGHIPAIIRRFKLPKNLL